MGPVLKGLIQLQTVESRLRAVKAKLTRCKRNIVIQNNQLTNLTSTLEAKKEELNLTKLQSDQLELELKSRDETIAKLRAFLNAAKTNKEYALLLTRLNTTKADNSKIENQILELMKQIEADEAECLEIQIQIEQQKQKLQQTKKETDELSTQYEAEIDQIQDQWNQSSRDIPAEQLNTFNRVAEIYDGEGLAQVEQQEGKKGAYVCGGCFMGLPAEVVNLLMTKDDVIRCPNCTRILVLSDTE